MAYIGRNPAIGTQKVLDSLESQFNGTLTTFDLRYNSNTIYPPIASALIVSLGGVLQEPGVAYTVTSDTITFATAPPTGTDCWILLYTEFGAAGGGSANFTVSNNLTIGNELHGPANFVIDPATIGDNTGTVEIKGNLTVQGTQTTVNSTTVDLDHLSLGDNEIANFGDNDDLEIYHNGSNSVISHGGAGNLSIKNTTIDSDIVIQSDDGSGSTTQYFRADGGTGEVKLYHYGTQKFTTESTGVTVTGTVAADGLSLGDNDIANFGTDNDIQIVHESTGSKSVIKRTTTGDFYIQGASGSWIRIEALPGESSIKAAANGTVELYYDNSKKFETTNTGVTITGTAVADGLSLGDSEVANFGNSDDLKIFHDGSNNYIQGVVGNIILKNSAGDYFVGNATNGAVELYYNNSKKLETTNTGVTVTGALEVSAATNITVGGTALPSLTGLLGGSLDGTLGTVTMAYLPSAPNSPVQGQFYFNSLNQKAQIYTGSAFVDLVPSGGGGGGGAGTTDAQATFRKYTYSITSTTNAVSGSSDTVVTAGNFVVGNVYTIKTIGTTDFTAIGASANTVGVQFTATGAGTGTGDAYDTLYYATGGIQNIEVYVNGVKSVEGSTNDYVATTGTSVNFTANLASGDVVDIQVYELLTNDAFVLATGGTFTGNVGINTSTINNRLHIHSDANEQGILLTQAGDNYSAIISDANRSATDKYILNLEAKWNGAKVARIALETGDDTTNKDDGRIKFFTSAASGNPGIAMRIDPDGKVGIGGDHDPLSPLHVSVNTASLLRLERIGNTNAAIRYENNTASMFAGLSTNATFFGIGTAENLGSSSTQLCVMRETGNVGIGTTGPSSALEVVGDIQITNGTQNNAIRTNSAGQLQFMRNAPSNNQVTVTIDDETGYVGIGTDSPVNLLQLKGGDATLDNNTYIGFNIYNNSGWYQVGTGNGAVLKHHSTNGFQIYTGADSGNGAGGAASVSAKLTVADNGNVGVGINTPDAKLHVRSSAGSGWQIRTDSSGLSNESGFYRDANDDYEVVLRNGDGGLSFIKNNGGASTANLRFNVQGSESLTIAADGNVGVGTNTPTSKFYVRGGEIRVENGASSTYIGGDHGRSIEIGVGLETSDAKTAFIDFHVADDVTGQGDNSYRIERNSGANGNIVYANKGTGHHGFQQNGTTGLRIYSSYLDVPHGPVYITNHAIVSSWDSGGISGTNIDHFWHDDASEFGANGSWVFNSDAGYKSETSGDFSNIKVGHVYVDNGNLGSAAGNVRDLARFYANNGNATSIRLQAKRKVTGTNWNSAGYKIFCHTDATEQGYIEFNPHTTTAGDGNYHVAIGSNNGELVRFQNTGNVGIGTLTPQEKLHIEGNIQINDVKMGALVTPAINDDAYYDVTVPNTAGLMIITPFSGGGFPDYPQPQGSGMVWYDVGLSRNAYLIDSFSGSTLEVLTSTTSTTVTDMTDGALTVAPLNSTTNVIRLFNRVGGTNSGQRRYKLVFL